MTISELESINKRNTILQRLKAIRITRKNIGWWVLAAFIFLCLVGLLYSNFIDPSVSYIEPVLWILDFFLSFLGFSIYQDYRYPDILYFLAKGAIITLQISIISIIIGFILGLILALILVQKRNILGIRWIAQVYVDFFRSTPLLVQLFIVYYGLPMFIQTNLGQFGAPFDRFVVNAATAGIIALSLNTGAYQAEILRSGILAIPIGQTEASRALGMTQFQTMIYVIIPQALRIIIPPLTNEAINLLLNSSLLSTIAVSELTRYAKDKSAKYYLAFETYLLAAIFYFIIAFSLAKLTKVYERKYRIPGLGVSCE